MEPIPASDLTEFAAAFLQATITVGLAALFLVLYMRLGKRYFAWWALAWGLYALRLGAIITFLSTADWIWLYWHQVITGWTALALLWAALVFSRQLRWRWSYAPLLLFPPLWSYVAIYTLDNFLLAAGPAVLFLSAATLWTAWVFFRHHRQVGSAAALLLAVAMLLWAGHHLDYPFLRARGAWNPWGYYIDIVFVLAMGVGIVMLVVEDLQRGLQALSALSGDLVSASRGADVLSAVLRRPLALQAVRGSAMYRIADDGPVLLQGAGICETWRAGRPAPESRQLIERVSAVRKPEFTSEWRMELPDAEQKHSFGAAIPIQRRSEVVGVMVMVSDVRDPFAALDERFLTALGSQIGAALENADLYHRLEERSDELEHLARRMVRQHEEERLRLSRELHDETAQVFSAVKLRMGLLREKVSSDLADRVDQAVAMIDSGIRGIRSVTNRLRPSLLDDLGLAPAVRALVDDFSEGSQLRVSANITEDVPPLSDEAELALFRAVQEGLSNVVRHSNASSVEVSLTVDKRRVRLCVKDDGDGMKRSPDEDTRRHTGITGMRERVAALGGTVAVGNGSGGGVTLQVEIPEGDNGD